MDNIKVFNYWKNLFLDVKGMDSIQAWEASAKCQCEIVRGAFLKDHSSNGTWINEHKVGKDNLLSLEHNSVICFAEVSLRLHVD